MPEQDSIHELEKAASPALQGHRALRRAVELYRHVTGNESPGENESIIRLAERIRVSTLKASEDLFHLEELLEVGPQDLVTSDYLVRRISPWMDTMRQELFGAPEPPFIDDLESALGWIETTVRLDQKEKNPFTVSVKREIMEKAEEEAGSVPFLMRTLYVPDGNRVKAFWVQPGTLLYQCSRKIDTIFRATGFNHPALTVYLLTGLEPLLPRVTISVNLGQATLPPAKDYGEKGGGGELLTRRSLRVEIHSADLSPEELKIIYEQYRRALRIRKMKTLSREQVRLFYLVLRRGGPPDRGSKAFWQEIREEWNRLHESKPYRSWEGVYQRYKIVERKMENLFFKNSR